MAGVDISDVAIEAARTLARETGADAQFIAADMYEMPSQLRDIDVIFAQAGVVCWLPDLDRWAQMIADRLRPGGTFLLNEHHPIAASYIETGIVSTLVISWAWMVWQWRSVPGAVFTGLVAVMLVVSTHAALRRRLVERLQRRRGRHWMEQMSYSELAVPSRLQTSTPALRDPRIREVR